MIATSRTLYGLADFDRTRLYVDEEIPAAAGFVFQNLRAFSSTREPEGTRSFSQMLSDVVGTSQTPESLALSTEQLVVVASRGQESIGLSIIECAASVGVDTLTWITPRWRHRGLATAMKIQAIHDARKASIDALWGLSDADGRSFYEALGLRPS